MSKVYASVALNERVPEIAVEPGIGLSVKMCFAGDGLVLYVDRHAVYAMIEALERAKDMLGTQAVRS